jgi:peptidoglycan/xylan/chitin deacetylase (PgdA/CDA1 family)
MSDISVLKRAKIGTLRLAQATQVSRLLGSSAWRRNRLLILCYHGVSRYDEHEWNGSLYMTPALLRRRLQLVADMGCNVLPLTEALSRLRSGTLPERAVALTFDDGFQDFYSLALPIVESFGFPVTLYLTTYYVEFNRPIFRPMSSYLLWKGRDQQRFEFPEISARPFSLDDAGRPQVIASIREFALSRKLSGLQKDELLARVAGSLGVDYADLCRRRVLHLVNPQEAREVASRGVSLEYHTHRHRIGDTRGALVAELQDNRRRIMMFTSHEPRHFCYTSGYHLPQHPGFLEEYGMLSATTCRTGMCTTRSHPMLLPRLVDGMGMTDVEFCAWLTGTAEFLPRRNEDDPDEEPASAHDLGPPSLAPHQSASEPAPQAVPTTAQRAPEDRFGATPGGGN